MTFQSVLVILRNLLLEEVILLFLLLVFLLHLPELLSLLVSFHHLLVLFVLQWDLNTHEDGVLHVKKEPVGLANERDGDGEPGEVGGGEGQGENVRDQDVNSRDDALLEVNCGIQTLQAVRTISIIKVTEIKSFSL